MNNSSFVLVHKVNLKIENNSKNKIEVKYR